MWRRLMMTAGLSMVAAACTATTARRDVRGEPGVLLPEEMASAGVTDAYQAVVRLRPLFIKNRVGAQLTEQTRESVYLDDVRLGGLETLRTIPIEMLRSIRYLSAGEATYRWGANHSGGVILLSTRE